VILFLTLLLQLSIMLVDRMRVVKESTDRLAFYQRITEEDGLITKSDEKTKLFH
jgi:hypothetical protein